MKESIPKKFVADFNVIRNIRLSDMYSRLVLRMCDSAAGGALNEVRPGQFVEVLIPEQKTTFLRRPISVNFVTPYDNEIHLLVRKAGNGTKFLCEVEEGQLLNLVLPLGNGFSLNPMPEHPLLVGGGVGVAPLLYLGKKLADNGIRPTFLLAAKTKNDLLEVDRFRQYGEVILSTDDGSAGHQGLVTENPALRDGEWDMVYCCGPMPMMKAVAAIAAARDIRCEVSLENTMACGLGACLCCVEDTVDGNVCVCKDGPVFDVKRLKWL